MAEPISLARPYAVAAFESAQSADQLRDWSTMLGLAATIAADPQVEQLVGHPGIEDDQWLSAFKDIGGDQFDQPFGNFLAILAENQRLSLLPDIAALFELQKAEAEQTMRVRVVAATELTDTQRDQLVARLARRFDRNIGLSVDIDPSMLGGAVIYAGDAVIDGSLRSQFSRLEQNLAA